MRNISYKKIKKLINHTSRAPAITIYLPTHKSASPPHMTEDQIRFKNLTNKALDILKKRDDSSDLEDLLVARAEELLNDRSFWETRSEGLLICACPDTWEMFDLPIDTEEYVAVNTYFHLAPILSLLQDSTAYHVLVVAQHAPALFKGDMYDLTATGVELPKTMEDGLQLDEAWQRSIQMRSVSGTGFHGVGFHGHGGAKGVGAEDRLRFWRMLDQIVCDKADKKLPLILAGVESELIEYRAEARYPKILDGCIKGNFSGVHPHELFEPALKIVKEEIIDVEHAAALENYLRLKGENRQRTGDNFSAIVDAAEMGRVSTLLVGMNRFTTDTIRDNTEPVPVITFPGSEESTETIHDTALAVWNQGGAVVNIEESDMPNGLPMAAIFRY